MHRSTDDWGPPPSYQSTSSSSRPTDPTTTVWAQHRLGNQIRRPDHETGVRHTVPVSYSPNEETPLYNGTSKNSFSRPSRLIRVFAAAVILLLGFIFNWNYVIHQRTESIDPIDWATQREAWVLDHERWALDHQLWQLDRAKWQEDREDWDKDRREWERERRKEEKERQSREEAERKRHEEAERTRRREAERKRLEEAERKRRDELERKKREEAERKRREAEERKRREEAVRKRREAEERRRREEAERKRREVEERERHEEEERKRREEEDRSRSGMYWDTPQPAEHCMAYETRRYQARLWNIPFMWNWEEACRNTPVTIAGKNISTPDQCVDQGWEGMYGIWDVKSKQTGCQSYWSPMWNRGCIADGSQKRRFDSQMYGMVHGDDWYAMCSTTPVQIDGIIYSSPTRCELKEIRKVFHTEWGMYGTWELYDPDC